jgi:hypothetical protein
MANPYDYFNRPDDCYEVPTVQCSKCKRWQDDHDGFGVLKCEHCDYCSHASITDGVCGLCGSAEGKGGSHGS